MVIDTPVKYKTIKILENNIEEYLPDWGVGKDKNEKSDKMTYVKLKKVYSSKRHD